jgi:hypothetical protein
MSKHILCDDLVVLQLRDQIYGTPPKPKHAINPRYRLVATTLVIPTAAPKKVQKKTE